MLSLLILLIVVWNFYIGYNRGLILQAFYSLGALLAFFVASTHYVELAKKIALWVPYSNPTEGAGMSFFTSVNMFKLDQVYYAGVAFCAVFFLTYVLIRLIGVLVHFAPIDYFSSWKTNCVSGGLAALVTCLFLTLGFSVLATVPMPTVQNTLASSGLIKFLVNHFPIFSGLIQHLWVVKIIG